MELVRPDVGLERGLRNVVQFLSSALRRKPTLLDQFAQLLLRSVEEFSALRQVGCPLQVLACLAHLLGCKGVETTVQDDLLGMAVEVWCALVDEGVPSEDLQHMLAFNRDRAFYDSLFQVIEEESRGVPGDSESVDHIGQLSIVQSVLSPLQFDF